MEDKALVKSSFSAIINAHIEEVDIPRRVDPGICIPSPVLRKKFARLEIALR